MFNDYFMYGRWISKVNEEARTEDQDESEDLIPHITYGRQEEKNTSLACP